MLELTPGGIISDMDIGKDEKLERNILCGSQVIKSTTLKIP